MKKRIISTLLASCLLLSYLPMVAMATKTATTPIVKTEAPTGNTTKDQPFPKGTGESNSFRIPALITLGDGSILAAADARWNTLYDGGGHDTIVSRSTDNGETWKWSYANYFGDNGNRYNAQSTCFIDPSLTTDGKTVWLLVDLLPYGVAMQGDGNTFPAIGVNGFDDNGRLLLSDNDHSTYDYYLDGNVIKRLSDGQPVEGYTVDGHFNIKGTNGTNSNLFFSDSPYKVQRTTFLYLVKSTDNGLTWSTPTLLNLKKKEEQAYFVGPGRGLVTSTGRIVIPCYRYIDKDTPMLTSFVYSDDNGTTWNRSADANTGHYSSESAVVELNDGRLRFFYRNGNSRICYIDYFEEKWLSPVITKVTNHSDCEVSAIKYSKTSGGKEVIFVSCPTGNAKAEFRINGKIFCFLVNDNNDRTMDLQNFKIDVTTGGKKFLYSCLTELNNGKLAILYENDFFKPGEAYVGDGYYYSMQYGFYTVAGGGRIQFDPKFTSQPQDVSVTYGDKEKVVLSAEIENSDTTPNIKYEWYYKDNGKDVLIPSAKGKTYEVGTDTMPVGTYEFFCKGSSTIYVKGKASTVSTDSRTVTVTVEKAPLIANIDTSGVTKVYDGTKNIVGQLPTITLSGAVNEEVPVLNSDGVVFSYDSADAGVDKTITATNLTLSSDAVNANYKLSSTANSAGAEITKVDVVITPNDGQQKPYGANDPQFTYTSSIGDISNGITGELGRSPGEDTGEYDFNIGSLDGGNNYNLMLDSNSPKFTIINASVRPNDYTLDPDAKVESIIPDADSTPDDYTLSPDTKLDSVLSGITSTSYGIHVMPTSGSAVASGGVALSLPVNTEDSVDKGGDHTTTTKAMPSATINGNMASSDVSDQVGEEMIRQVEENGSRKAVIAPKIDGDVTKTEVSIPASTVEQIGEKTNADLIISTSVADVSILNSVLDNFDNKKGIITVVTEKVGNDIILDITSDGEKVNTLSGGVTLAVPYEDCKPGTVAVLVQADGSRKVIRKSMANSDDLTVSIPLDGSAKVEIVDNSKVFDDVKPDDWYKDVVDFVSSHEIFQGTNTSTFSPNDNMTRGMLITAIYNLENNPKQSFDNVFSDVNSDVWYSDSVTWAADQGISLGYGEGIFGPDDFISREQLAVILWRYCGSIRSDETLNFNDADTVSSWAKEALCWAVENEILEGKDNGILAHKDYATRAEAATMIMRCLQT